jgi:hypothetical protein
MGADGKVYFIPLYPTIGPSKPTTPLIIHETPPWEPFHADEPPKTIRAPKRKYEDTIGRFDDQRFDRETKITKHFATNFSEVDVYSHQAVVREDPNTYSATTSENGHQSTATHQSTSSSAGTLRPQQWQIDILSSFIQDYVSSQLPTDSPRQTNSSETDSDCSDSTSIPTPLPSPRALKVVQLFLEDTIGKQRGVVQK